MKQRIVAANWKMNKTLFQGKEWIAKLLDNRQNFPVNTQIILAAPFTHLESIVKRLKGTAINVSAQNCHHYKEGAYTGEVSASMLSSIGIRYVIIGHSERRIHFDESNLILHKKLEQVFNSQLNPILCCGEKKIDREENNYLSVIQEQVEVLLSFDRKCISSSIIAYEPVWAIGTGNNATLNQAEEIHQFIRKILKEKFDENFANKIPIIYGGSCNSSNAKLLFSMPNIDGGLIGSASLDIDDFLQIINA